MLTDADATEGKTDQLLQQLLELFERIQADLMKQEPKNESSSDRLVDAMERMLALHSTRSHTRTFGSNF